MAHRRAELRLGGRQPVGFAKSGQSSLRPGHVRGGALQAVQSHRAFLTGLLQRDSRQPILDRRGERGGKRDRETRVIAPNLDLDDRAADGFDIHHLPQLDLGPGRFAKAASVCQVKPGDHGLGHRMASRHGEACLNRLALPQEGIEVKKAAPPVPPFSRALNPPLGASAPAPLWQDRALARR